MLNCIIRQMHVLCLSFFHFFLIGSLMVIQEKKKFNTTCQTPIKQTSTIHSLENQALRSRNNLTDWKIDVSYHNIFVFISKKKWKKKAQ